ncbi:MAG: hypothetical protein ABI707_02425 [Ferruginibacter sp.]
MELKVEIPFQQLLSAVKTHTPTQKAKLRKELNEKKSARDDKSAFIGMLLNEPVYTEKQIQIIEKTPKALQDGGQKVND